MAKNARLNKANILKNDEFYTQMPDIEAEMLHYRDHFRGKVIFCNCDDPFESNFFKYFAMNFNFLGLKKLIATCYSDSPVAWQQLALLDVKNVQLKNGDARLPYKIEISEVHDENGDGAVGLADVEVLLKNGNNALTLLRGDGDFRSAECIELLKQADIVVTNPPFSLFRDYILQLVEHKKKFIILGNQNAITYKEIFKLIKENLVWLGFDNGGTKWFQVPLDYEIMTESRIKFDSNGHKFFSMGNIMWFTNIDTSKRHEMITLYKPYIHSDYPRYVNYDAIEVSRVVEIPYDYDGEMGVPITFLDKYNPDQFEIIGSSRFVGKPMSGFAPKGTYVEGGMRFYLPNGDGTYQRLYDRIVIKRKGSQQ